MENDNEGIDTLFATIDIDLTLARYANVESVVLFDGDDHNLTGSDGDNGLYGATPGSTASLVVRATTLLAAAAAPIL